MAGRGIVTLLCYSLLSVTFFHCCSFHCSQLALYTGWLCQYQAAAERWRTPAWKGTEDFDWLREGVNRRAPMVKKGCAGIGHLSQVWRPIVFWFLWPQEGSDPDAFWSPFSSLYHSSLVPFSPAKVLLFPGISGITRTGSRRHLLMELDSGN